MTFRFVLALIAAITSIASQSIPETKHGARIVGGYPIEVSIVVQLSLFLK